jgi:hypothetical protein
VTDVDAAIRAAGRGLPVNPESSLRTLRWAHRAVPDGGRLEREILRARLAIREDELVAAARYCGRALAVYRGPQTTDNQTQTERAVA